MKDAITLLKSVQKVAKEKFIDNPKAKWIRRGVWAVSLVFAGVIAIQSIPYYTYIGTGKQAYQQGHYKEAEPKFKAAMKEAEGLGWYYFGGPERDPRLAAAINNLAELYRTQGRYLEAEPLYKRLLSIAEKLGNKHQGLPMSLNNLAALYRDQGRYAEAEPLYKRAIDIWEKEIKRPDDSNLANIYNGLGKLYRDEGRYAEAEPAYKKALQISEKALGPNQQQAASMLDNLGGLYREEARFTESEQS